MFSDRPGTPARKQQMLRTIRSIRAPACDAAYSSSIISESTIAFIFIAMTPSGCACERMSSRNASRTCIGATMQPLVLAGPAVAGEVVEELGEVGAEIGLATRARRDPRTWSRSSGCSCRCRRGSSGGCRRPLAARRAGSWRASSGPTRPYTTCAPACSSMRARSMFACSSKRAFSSTSATTCLPASAALASDVTMPASSPPVR